MYIESVIKQFKYYKLLGEKTFEQLDDKQLFNVQPNVNPIPVIVKHLWGNMLSRWTNFFEEDGEKEWRKREEEFTATINNREELMEKWNAGWECLFLALNMVSNDNLDTIIYIRNQGHTVVEAVNRQLAHYSYHVGQIVYIGTLLKGEYWQSLSIPKGKSKEYNKQKFANAKSKKHFTDEYLGS